MSEKASRIVELRQGKYIERKKLVIQLLERDYKNCVSLENSSLRRNNFVLCQFPGNVTFKLYDCNDAIKPFQAADEWFGAGGSIYYCVSPAMFYGLSTLSFGVVYVIRRLKRARGHAAPPVVRSGCRTVGEIYLA